MKRKESAEEFYQRRKAERSAVNRRMMRMTALIMQLGITMLTCLLLCGIPGRMLAVYTGHPVIFPLFLLLGILAGFRSCFQVIERFYGRLGIDRRGRAGQEKGPAGSIGPDSPWESDPAARRKETLTAGEKRVLAAEEEERQALGGKEEDEDEPDEDPWL